MRFTSGHKKTAYCKKKKKVKQYRDIDWHVNAVATRGEVHCYPDCSGISASTQDAPVTSQVTAMTQRCLPRGDRDSRDTLPPPWARQKASWVMWLSPACHACVTAHWLHTCIGTGVTCAERWEARRQIWSPNDRMQMRWTDVEMNTAVSPHSQFWVWNRRGGGEGERRWVCRRRNNESCNMLSKHTTVSSAVEMQMHAHSSCEVAVSPERAPQNSSGVTAAFLWFGYFFPFTLFRHTS